MKRWHIKDSAELYNLQGWGVNYFDINEKGHMVVTPKKDDNQIDIRELIDELALCDIQPPVLLRFCDIIEKRMERMKGGYDNDAKE